MPQPMPPGILRPQCSPHANGVHARDRMDTLADAGRSSSSTTAKRTATTASHRTTCPQGATTAGETVPSWFAWLGQPSWPVSTRGIRATPVWSQPASVRSCRNWTTGSTLQPDTDRAAITCGTQQEPAIKNVATRAKQTTPIHTRSGPSGLRTTGPAPPRATGHRTGPHESRSSGADPRSSWRLLRRSPCHVQRRPLVSSLGTRVAAPSRWP